MNETRDYAKLNLHDAIYIIGRFAGTPERQKETLNFLDENAATLDAEGDEALVIAAAIATLDVGEFASAHQVNNELSAAAENEMNFMDMLKDEKRRLIVDRKMPTNISLFEDLAVKEEHELYEKMLNNGLEVLGAHCVRKNLRWAREEATELAKLLSCKLGDISS